MNKRRDGNAGKSRAAEFFCEHDTAERVHVRAAINLGITNSEEAERAHAPQHFARHKTLLLPGIAKRLDLFLDETPHLIAQHFMLLGEERRARVRPMAVLFRDLIHIRSSNWARPSLTARAISRLIPNIR